MPPGLVCPEGLNPKGGSDGYFYFTLEKRQPASDELTAMGSAVPLLAAKIVLEQSLPVWTCLLMEFRGWGHIRGLASTAA